VLGFVVPVILLAQGYLGLRTLSGMLDLELRQTPPAQAFSQVQPFLHLSDDYAVFSLMSEERVNQSVVVNKQLMKVVVVQIGFSVISLGLMLIVLGINDGGGEGSGEFNIVKFDFKTGSTGVLVFVIGATMATVGGTLKNDYATVPIPDYGAVSQSDNSAALKYYRDCKSLDPNNYKKCFVNTFEEYLPKGDGE